MCSSRRFTVAVGRSCPRRIVLGRIVVPLIVVSGLAGAPSLTEAANIYWDGLGTTWNSTTDWSTASNATTPHPAAVPGAADVANFNISTVNTAQTVNLDAAQSALGLDFTSTGAVTINNGTGTNAITIGLGGITVAAGSVPTRSTPMSSSVSPRHGPTTLPMHLLSPGTLRTVRTR